MAAAANQATPRAFHGGKLIIVTAPSGAGKTTIVRHLLRKFDKLGFSVSATTRPKRHYETDGKDYYFLSENEFLSRIEKDQFVEWEEVYPGSYYGTLRSEVNRQWANGKHLVFDVDVKGALTLKSAFPDNSLSIFISPPSLEELGKRLINRKTEDEKSLRKRLDRAQLEMNHADRFDVKLINDQLDRALIEAENLVTSFLAGVLEN